ncbi:MAG: phage terminase large subunit family protein [Hyphomicrobiaceae bacterium]
MLSPESSAEPGRWRTDRVAYTRGIMDAFNDPRVREIVVKKGTQIAYTEVLLNVIGYCIDVEPCSILWLLPDQGAVDEISKNRLAHMLRDTAKIAEKVKPPRSRDSSNTIATKQFPGGRLSLVGSHAPSQLASRPIRVVIEDENDRFAQSAGAEGDPSALSRARQAWFWNAKTIKGSSPTVKGRSKIDRDHEASDKRMCYVPCPHCGNRQTLRWEQVRWDKVKNDKGETVEHRPHTAVYICEACGEAWDDSDRWAAIRDPEWRATAPFRGIAGFFLPQFYSPVRRLEQIVTEFLEAYGRLPGTHPDVTKQITWTNTVLAECWEEAGESVEASQLTNRGEPYGPDDLPDGVLFATAGVDVQADRLEMQTVGWGWAEEAWAIRYDVLLGDPAQPQVWADLDALLRRRMQTRSGRPVRIQAACVDTGGHHGHQVHQFCGPKFARRIFAIKGRAGPNVIFPKRASRTKTNQLVYLVGVDTAKDTIYGRLKIRRRDAGQPSPGYIHFPLASPDDDSFGPEYFAQLTSEQVVTRFREGRPVRAWVPVRQGARNEALDTFVYALAARHAVPIKLDHGRPTAQAAPPEPAVALLDDDDGVDETLPSPLSRDQPALTEPRLIPAPVPMPKLSKPQGRMARLARMQMR